MSSQPHLSASDQLQLRLALAQIAATVFAGLVQTSEPDPFRRSIEIARQMVNAVPKASKE